MKRGEVWRVRFPSAPGHTQSGERPAVIIQKDIFIPVLPTILVVPFTGTMATLRFRGTMAIPPDSRNGLTKPSVALVFQLRNLDKSDLLRRLGVLDPSALSQLVALVETLIQ